MRSPKSTLQLLLTVPVALVILGTTGWGVLAIRYCDQGPAALRVALALFLILSALGALIGLAARRWRGRTLTAFLCAACALLAWWSTIAPSNDRDWEPQVARLPQVARDGDLVTIRHIRDFDYRTPTDFDPGYYDRTFDLRKLESIDLIASYWSGPQIAHIFVSFGFGDDRFLAVSIERRDEKGEGYSTLRGLFRQYELFYVVADERDVIRLRTNYRNDPPEDVYLYRLQGPMENARRLFAEYMRRIDELDERPEFYNSVTSNCADNIWFNAHVNPGHVPYSWKILLSGHVPEYLYERGLLDTSLPFAELQERSRINAAAQAADGAADFSARIRAGLPGMTTR